MALEIPNVSAAAATALVTLLDIQGAAPVVRTFGVELVAAQNVAAVSFPDGDTTDDDPDPPAFLQFDLVAPVDPRQATPHGQAMAGVTTASAVGPVPTLTGDPLFDNLELGQVLFRLESFVMPEPPGGEAIGSQTRFQFWLWQTPPSGEVQ